MNLQKLAQEKLKEKFNLFLFEMSDNLEQLEQKTAENGYNLDYSISSLTQIENYIIENKISVNSNDYDGLSTYLGEVVRKNYGGKWICNLDEKNNSLYYGFPVIQDHSKYDVLFSPFHIVKAFIIRPKGNLFITAIESQINPPNIN